MCHSIKRRVLVGVAALAGVISTLGLAAPAQAAPSRLTADAVYYLIPNKYTPVPPKQWDGISFELRAGYYEGSQYAWARITPGFNWTDYVLNLQITDDGGANWENAEQISSGARWGHTAGWITRADRNYQFRACLSYVLGTGACTKPW